jgi:redox-sensing transcriptional repressor
VAVFDRDAKRVGQKAGALAVQDIAALGGAAAGGGYDIGVIATPLTVAQEVADALVAAGVRGILNFAPRKLFVPDHVALRNVDMTMELESLSYALSQARGSRRRRPRE